MFVFCRSAFRYGDGLLSRLVGPAAASDSRPTGALTLSGSHLGATAPPPRIRLAATCVNGLW